MDTNYTPDDVLYLTCEDIEDWSLNHCCQECHKELNSGVLGTDWIDYIDDHGHRYILCCKSRNFVKSDCTNKGY